MKAEDPSTQPWILFYDGACILCSSFVRMLMKADRKARIHFASLSSSKAQELNNLIGKKETVVLAQGSRYWIKSAVVFQILRILGGAWRVGLIFQIIPLHWLDTLYDLIAKNRYRMQRKPYSCRLPGPAYRSRFLHP